MTEPPAATLVLTRSDVARVLDLGQCIEIVERAFRAHGEGRAPDPAIMGVHVASGGFHTKGGVLDLGRPYFAAKTNANFMHNRERYGLPTIQGTIALHDAENGFPLALMDSVEISILRTGAATAVAAKHLARPDSAVAAVAGCGAQGRVQVRATARVLPLTRVLVWDIDRSAGVRLAEELSADLALEVIAVDDFRVAAREADVCITCTPSEEYLLRLDDVRPGTFVAGVGADNPHKRELHPSLLAAGTVVVDVLEQCATIGDLHHALDAGVMDRAHVHGSLGAVVAGRLPGRTHPGEITVFDSTGMAVQDVAAAAVVYEGALRAGVGRMIDLAH
ncbi:MAG TPA: ornithine cyclodeaminase family protein [Gemmatimonadaceae bacterium]|nr:ornithine cyclodeaminase family protein [Gemmatimonadaceae bacterium]